MTIAFLAVDPLPTFCEGGELPTEGATASVLRMMDFIAEHGAEYDGGLYVSRERHPAVPTTDSLREHFETFGAHGVAGTPNAELHPWMQGFHWTAIIDKGQDAAAFSAFEGMSGYESFDEILWDHGVTHIDMGGLLFTHCVKASALDAVKLGYTVTVISDLTVPLSPELGVEALAELRAAGVEVRSSDDF